jgi:glyceraldehyde 3-phosphate dehydrogenase
MVLRAFHERNLLKIDNLPDLQGKINIVAVNDLAPVDTNIHLLKYDSTHGPFVGKISVKKDVDKKVPAVLGSINVGYGPILLLQEPNPENIPWEELKVDMVLECSGRFTAYADASKHLVGGAKRVFISAPGANADFTVVYGVNHKKLEKTHQVISNASCTTNCLAPIAKVLNESVGIECGHMTTIHAYTGDQRIVDTAHKDLRRARAAGVSMIPTSTGAAKAVSLVLPELLGKLDGVSIRVPTPNVSAIDFSFVSSKITTADELNEILKNASTGEMLGIVDYSDAPLVSTEFNHSPASATIDSLQTKVIDGKLCRVFAWYDNEWGFSNRMLDVAAYIRSSEKGSFFGGF